MPVSPVGTSECQDRVSSRRDAAALSSHGLRMHDGIYTARVKGIGAGARYWFRIDGAGPYPDPASRFQPLGVHGPSQVVDPDHFAWRDIEFQPPSLRELVLYELHVGTFTPAGTFLGVIEKLDDLRRLGVNAVELMPIADFAGERNWGYDGVSLYAPARSYGTPDDFARWLRKRIGEGSPSISTWFITISAPMEPIIPSLRRGFTRVSIRRHGAMA